MHSEWAIVWPDTSSEGMCPFHSTQMFSLSLISQKTVSYFAQRVEQILELAMRWSPRETTSILLEYVRSVASSAHHSGVSLATAQINKYFDLNPHNKHLPVRDFHYSLDWSHFWNMLYGKKNLVGPYWKNLCLVKFFQLHQTFLESMKERVSDTNKNQGILCVSFLPCAASG